MKIIATIFLALNSFASIGQITFNKYYMALDRSTIMQTVNVTDSGYAVSGGFTDTTGVNHSDLALFILDIYGNQMGFQHYGEVQSEYLVQGHGNSLALNFFIQQSISFVADTPSVALIWYNNQGDTLLTRNYFSPYLETQNEFASFISCPYYVTSADSTSYVSHVICNDATYCDAILRKVDVQGNTLWIYYHATMSDPDMIMGIVPREDGVIYCAQESGFNTTPTNHAIVKLNPDGEFQWRIDSENFLPGTQLLGTILLDDQSIIVSGSYEEPGMQDVYSIACIYKVDTLGNLAWFTTYGEYWDQAYRDFTNVVQTSDGNYVCAGTWKTIPGSEEIAEGYTAVDYDEFAYVVKFDRNDGHIIWERKYRWLEVYRENHTVFDLKATLDGGVVFCGIVHDQYHQFFDFPYQRGWVVKLDECGCLIPECDTLCTIDMVEEGTDAMSIGVYPNPAAEILNVHIGPYTLDKKTQIVLVDAHGHIASSHAIKENNTTYMLSVDDLPSGLYVLILQNEKGVLATEKVSVH